MRKRCECNISGGAQSQCTCVMGRPVNGWMLCLPYVWHACAPTFGDLLFQAELWTVAASIRPTVRLSVCQFTHKISWKKYWMEKIRASLLKKVYEMHSSHVLRSFFRLLVTHVTFYYNLFCQMSLSFKKKTLNLNMFAIYERVHFLWPLGDYFLDIITIGNFMSHEIFCWQRK